MAFTLADMVQGALRKMGALKISKTTAAGSSTTLVDSFWIGKASDNDYQYAPVFIIQTPTSAAPMGEWNECTAYADATGTFTTSTFSAAVSSGTTYGVGTPEFRITDLIEIANDALLSLGDMTNVDVNVITSSVSQTDYNLPVAYKRAKPIRIDMQGTTISSGTQNQWVTMDSWEYQPSSGGAVGKIVFRDQPPSGRQLRVWYEGDHLRLSAAAGVIDERVNPELAKLALCEKLYEYRNSMNRGSLPFDVQRWNDAKTQLQEAKARFPIWGEKRSPKIIAIGEGAGDHLPYPPPYGPP